MSEPTTTAAAAVPKPEDKPTEVTPAVEPSPETKVETPAPVPVRRLTRISNVFHSHPCPHLGRAQRRCQG